MSNKIRVAVSGMGCLSALGLSVESCMKNMLAGVRKLNPPQRFSTTHEIQYPVFEITNQFKKPESKPNQDLTLTAQMAIAAVYQALEDARIDKSYLEKKRVGGLYGNHRWQCIE